MVHRNLVRIKGDNVCINFRAFALLSLEQSSFTYFLQLFPSSYSGFNSNIFFSKRPLSVSSAPFFIPFCHVILLKISSQHLSWFFLFLLHHNFPATRDLAYLVHCSVPCSENKCIESINDNFQTTDRIQKMLVLSLFLMVGSIFVMVQHIAHGQ